MKGNNQAYAQQNASEGAVLAFKQFILDHTAAFEQTPEADLFRVNTLAQMLDRYEQISANGGSEAVCIQRVIREFSDIAAAMRSYGYEEIEAEADAYGARWPMLSEDDAAKYIKESSDRLHKRAIGTALCSACVMPLMIFAALSELIWRYTTDAMSLLGVACMFGMIGMGIYSMTTAKAPADEKKIKKKRFSLSRRLRSKIGEYRDAAAEKARKRRGLGIALLATCVVPIFIGGALDSPFGGDAWAVLGVGGMFGMIGAGVYELIMAGGEKKAADKLLKE